MLRDLSNFMQLESLQDTPMLPTAAWSRVRIGLGLPKAHIIASHDVPR